MLSFDQYQVLTFDCYGTLIDWESGILSALRPVLQGHGLDVSDERALELYAELESRAERGEYQSYRNVLRAVMSGMGRALGFEPTQSEVSSLETSLGHSNEE